MKKKIALLTVVLIVAMVVLGGSMTAYAGHQCSVTVIIGDVNLDGSVDSIDLALLYNTNILCSTFAKSIAIYSCRCKL